MNIRLSNHALHRANDRGIRREDIELTIREAEEIIEVKFGRKAAFRQFGDKFLVVIFEEQKDEIVVVTELKVDKERLKRYGFSRI
ncbi:hypothetical protein Asulf_00897 [Archaeoglobus sulfaticallidus PM70-1]|uniref:DUF4258 domain-containing protein n=1 Tax=Archaeoglobus sulfaticallidus PM70-1 TaxID=387631 RepID=N0BBC5_9EURY|nr:DUF4258 domain-containing protein [Archaeoglobus sulfaticallidus]AGK60904.1 hypothetical protein Asulf_00897 [Archaeoglobus sulfaticallidus PM70-1]